jgi:DUF2934 family protein
MACCALALIYPPLSLLTYHDQYQRSPDGHIVGDDGFVVPRSFEEFYQEFPLHIHNFVRRHMTHSSMADREDRESELNLFLMSLPAVSKFREPGTNGFEDGCRDRVQTFHPDRAYGASKARFLNFINYLLLNAFITLGKRVLFHPIERRDNFSYTPGNNGSLPSVDDEYLFKHLLEEGASTIVLLPELEAPVLIEEFRSFIERHSPELLALYHCLLTADTFLDAQAELGMNEQLFTRARNRLQVLVDCFHESRRVPRQRKLYRLRPKTRPLTPPTYHQIELAAYHLWEERGRSAEENWLDAERLLNSFPARAEAPVLTGGNQ